MAVNQIYKFITFGINLTPSLSLQLSPSQKIFSQYSTLKNIHSIQHFNTNILQNLALKKNIHNIDSQVKKTFHLKVQQVQVLTW